jgi:phasin family protein
VSRLVGSEMCIRDSASPEQLSAASKASVDAFVGLASTQFAAFERLTALSFNAGKLAFEDSVGLTRSLLGAKDVQEVVNLNAAAAQPSFDKALAYSRGVYEVSSQTQSEFTKALEAQAAELNKTMVGLLDKMSKNAPAGSDVALTAVRSAMAAANQAYDSFTKVAKQATEIAEANFSAATTAAKETIKRKAK